MSQAFLGQTQTHLFYFIYELCYRVIAYITTYDMREYRQEKKIVIFSFIILKTIDKL